jgi:hypothetical protein
MIKQKFARTITLVAIRSWPQEWPELGPTLRSMITSSRPILVELAIFSLKTLAEDIFVFPENTPERRRSELKTAMLTEAPGLLDLLTSKLDALLSIEHATVA